MSDKHECDEEWTSESAWDTIERMSNDSITDEDLTAAMGKTLSFEYKSQISGWTYDEDIITDELIAASINFRNLTILN
jgi:hypothetical protein